MRKLLVTGFALTLMSLPAFADEPDGLILPPGFHATVVADGVTGARHLAVRDNGDIYVSTRGARNAAPTGIVALHLGADHKADQVEHFSDVAGGTGIRFYKGALYAASTTAIYRFTFEGDALVPAAAPETVIDGLPASGHILAFDGKGDLFVSLDGVGNICTDPAAPKTAKPVGLKPCPSLTGRAGVWRFDAAKTGLHFPADGEQYVTGIRAMGAMDWSQSGALYGLMHGRDATNRTWPELVSAADDDAIGDEMHRLVKGSDLGWPYTYYDSVRHLRLTGPEYGGDGKTPAPAGLYATPVASFAPRAAPLDVVFYNGTQFPLPWRGGAFIALHGGEGPDLAEGHNGYDIVYVTFDRSGHASAPKIFADGFAGPDVSTKNVSKAAYRPVGVAVGPDGALYVADSQKGRIWRIAYSGSD